MTEKASENKLEDYRLMCKLGEGTFSEVLKVKHKKTGKSYAMKRFRKHFDRYVSLSYRMFEYGCTRIDTSKRNQSSIFLHSVAPC